MPVLVQLDTNNCISCQVQLFCTASNSLPKGQNAGKNGLNAALKSPVQSLARKVLRVARRKIWQKRATSHEQSAESARPQHPEVQCVAPTERRTGQKQRIGLGIGKGGRMRR